MQIRDEGEKVREVSGLKVVTVQRRDVKGDAVTEEFVEYTVHGRTRDWKDWCPLVRFRELNPGVEV